MRVRKVPCYIASVDANDCMFDKISNSLYSCINTCTESNGGNPLQSNTSNNYFCDSELESVIFQILFSFFRFVEVSIGHETLKAPPLN